MMLGVIGGIGPLATAYFMELLVEMTDASKDQEHVPAMVINDVTIPDRTEYLTGRSDESPLPKMREDAILLQRCGCSHIAIPCNTSYCFYDEIQDAVDIPVIHMPAIAVDHAVKKDPVIKSIGVLATEGTLKSGVYAKAIERRGLKPIIPDEDDIHSLMHIIYDQVKAGEPADLPELVRMIGEMRKAGCDAVMLGCTELSIINRNMGLTKDYIYITDPLEVLAMTSITCCGKELRAPWKDRL